MSSPKLPMDGTREGGASPRMRPAVAWGLVASLLASAWALWWPSEPVMPPPSPSTEPPNAVKPALAVQTQQSVAAPVRVGSASSAEGSGEPPTLSAAARDPFNATPPPPAPTPQQSKAASSPAEVAPPAPPPPPPPMNHRVMGRFMSPGGQQMVFLQDGTQAVLAAPGAVLASGYVVEAVAAREVKLRHPLAEQAVSLPMPEDNAP